jgi:erythronate-4-phosphate dehydrogenase
MPIRIVADANIPHVEQCFSHLGQVVTVQGRQITTDLIRNAEILLVRSVTLVNRELLDGTAVRFVGTATIGYEHVDLDYLRERGIGFASAPGSNANSVAEYVIAALLEIAGRHGQRLADMSIGIVGAGHVGSLVDAKCKAIGMKTVLNDPPLARTSGDPIYRLIEEVFGCDIVTLHVPLTFQGPDRTYHLADEKWLASLRPGAIFINTSRGA